LLLLLKIDCGRRPYQQDDYLIITDLFGLKDTHLFGVFDGHGKYYAVKNITIIFYDNIFIGWKDFNILSF